MGSGDRWYEYIPSVTQHEHVSRKNGYIGSEYLSGVMWQNNTILKRDICSADIYLIWLDYGGDCRSSG